MKAVLVSLVVAVIVLIRPAVAQQSQPEVVWIQIEAHPSLRVAQLRAQDFAATLPDVNGFSLGGNWYGIVLGPYRRTDADRVLQAYAAGRAIPADSFITFSSRLGQQFWPVGNDLLGRGAVAAPALPGATPEPAQPVAQADPQPSDETPADARRSESLLTGAEREGLQIALRAAGFYNSAIDGAFGPGTRRSMADWQAANGYEATGVLTTAQRKHLMDDYNAPLISAGMAPHLDASAGIEMQIPAGLVRFSRYEPPFAHFDATGDIPVRLLLISQPGTRATLHGLYDIMQTLEIVPLNGPREKGKDSFTLEGRGNGIVSYTEASLQEGQIKGFTLVWPEGDEARRARVLAAMKSSFRRIDGVLDPATGGDIEQQIDLVSGLEIRKPRLSRSGFFVDRRGTVVTTAQAVQGCSRITLDHDTVAEVAASDADSGIAVLRPAAPLAPIAVARLRAGSPRLQSEVAVAGYSYEGILGAPTLTYGQLADVRGLNGEPGLNRLALAALPGDAGGPVVDAGGGVLGMLLPAPDGDRKLPENVSFAADADRIYALLAQAGITPERAENDPAPTDLDRVAGAMTVLVSCWD